MKPYPPILLLVCATAGCTAASLGRHTVNQALSVSDMRYQEIMDNFAKLADDPGAIPAFVTFANGTAVVTDTAGLESSTVWDQAIHGFSKETLTPSGKHNPDPNWTIDPVVAGPHLKALQSAFQYVLYGPPPPGTPAYEILSDREFNKYEYRFGVARDLATLPPTTTWLFITSRKNVPRDACYTSHCHDKYVSVRADGMQALSAFTLIVLDIATTDPLKLVPTPPTATIERRICIRPPSEEKCLTIPHCDKCQLTCPEVACPKEICLPSVTDSLPAPSEIMNGLCPQVLAATNSKTPDIDKGKTVITETWFVDQYCDGTIKILQPKDWCDISTVHITPDATPSVEPVQQLQLQQQ